jgi:hypothetical protein
VDSLDEMPSHHLEGPVWRKDLESTISRFENVRLIVASRRSGLVPLSGLDELTIHPLDENVVDDAISNAGLTPGSFSSDIIQALRTPFLLKVGLEVLPQKSAATRVAQLLETFLDSRLETMSVDHTDQLISSLSRVAYDASENGNDTIPLASIKEALVSVFKSDVTQSINELVRAGILVPEVGGAVRFVHRSILEYLASLELVRTIISGSANLDAILESTRWDDILVWSMNAVDAQCAREIFERVASWDFPLSIRLARNSEVGRDALLERILDLAPERGRVDRSTETEIQNTSFPKRCKTRLLALSQHANSLGETCAAAVLPLLTKKERILAAESFDSAAPAFPTAYAYAAVTGYLTPLELTGLLDRCKVIIEAQPEEERDDPTSLGTRADGIIRGAYRNHGSLLLHWCEEQTAKVRSRVCESITTDEFGDVYEFLVAQFDDGISTAISPLFLLYEEWPDEALEFSEQRLDFVVGQVARWKANATDLLTLCCNRSDDWRRALESRLGSLKNDFLKLGLTLASPGERGAAVAQIIERVLAGHNEYAAWFDDFYWSDLLNHWRDLIKLIARPLDDLEQYSHLFDFRNQPHFLSAEDLDWVLDRLSTLCEQGPRGASVAVHIGAWVSSVLDQRGKSRLIELINSDDVRRVQVFRFVLPAISSALVSTDDFSKEAQTSYLEDYLTHPSPRYGEPSPGLIATETFVRDVVLPMGETLVDSEARARLNAVLVDASAKHDVRYPLLDGGRLPQSRHRLTSLYYW